MSAQLASRLEQLTVDDSQSGAVDEQTLRKPRSQRFTVNTTATAFDSGAGSTFSTHPPMPSSLSFHPSPAPVQSQSIGLAQQTAKDGFFSRSHSATDSFTNSSSHLPSHPWNGPGFGSVGSFGPGPSPGGFGGGGAQAADELNGPSPPASTFSRASGAQHARARLPQEWVQDYPHQLGPPNGGFGALVDHRVPPHPQQRAVRQPAYAGPILPQDSDEVIPTAIVIKSIPFSCPREHLLGLMESLGLAPPFALNYHNENGQFRGLAFANYQSEDQAAMTVHALQGFELQGRKLRVEFKRVLKEGEKERIERDKAVRRMRSLGLDMRQQAKQDWNRQPLPPMPSQYNAYPAQGYGGYRAEEEDYGRVMSGQYSNGFGPPQAQPRNGPPGYYHHQPPGFAQFTAQIDPPFSNFGSPPSDPGTSISARIGRSPTDSSSDIPSLATVDVDSSSAGTANDLNLNEAESLEIYSRVLIFKDDSLRDELSFARSLDHEQRRKVHLVARKLALESKTVGEGTEKHVVVYKGTARSNAPPPASHKTLRHSASTLGRHTQAHAFLSPESSLAPVFLRAKQSMPDFRRRSSNNLRAESISSLAPSSSYNGAGAGIFSSGFFDPPAERNEEEEQKWRNSPSIADSRSGSSVSLHQLAEDSEPPANGHSVNGVQRQPKGPSEGEGGWWGRA